jgi:hypothetical protein
MIFLQARCGFIQNREEEDVEPGSREREREKESEHR